MEALIEVVSRTLPELSFALILYYMCNKNKEASRVAYMKIIDDYSTLLIKVLDKLDS